MKCVSPKGSVRFQQGTTLVVALIFLVALILIGVIAARSAMFDERLARNSRDVSVAGEGAEAALLSAESQIANNEVRGNQGFVDCLASNSAKGRCLPPGTVQADIQTYLARAEAELSNTGSTQTAAAGNWAAPAVGSGSPPDTPRYQMEVRPAMDAGEDATAEVGSERFVYRIYGRGFGHNQRINKTLLSVYRPGD